MIETKRFNLIMSHLSFEIYIFWSLDIICYLEFVICDFRFARLSQFGGIDILKSYMPRN